MVESLKRYHWSFIKSSPAPSRKFNFHLDFYVHRAKSLALTFKACLLRGRGVCGNVASAAMAAAVATAVSATMSTKNQIVNYFNFCWATYAGLPRKRQLRACWKFHHDVGFPCFYNNLRLFQGIRKHVAARFSELIFFRPFHYGSALPWVC
jgi:hypothetical protein